MDNKAEHSTSHSLASQVVKIFTAVEASSEAVFVTDNKGRIEYANQKFLNINGWQEEEALGRSISKVPHSNKIALKLLESLKNGQSWNMRHQVTSSMYAGVSGSELIWVRTSLDPIMETPDEISGYIGIQRVITQEVEQELQSKKELSKILGLAIRQEKTLEELKNSYDDALLQVVTKSAFLANMSHEIRTPLNGVLGMAELLKNTSLSNKQSHLTDIIQQSGKNLLNLINDILDLSKIEAGKLELSNSPHDLRLIMEEVVCTFSERAGSKGLELTCVYPANDHSLFICDKQRLIQILNNLISNAIKFTDKGMVVVRIRIDDNDLRFEVSDTGAGIPEEDQHTIFESFSQSQQTFEHAGKGTGLGLTICKHLVEIMDGDIGIVSTVGEGSTFWFTLELEKDTNNQYRPPINNDHLLAGLKVLIVDENTSNSENIAAQLKEWHIDSFTTGSVQTALEMLEEAQKKKHPFSQVIFDHDMSDICGDNFAKVVKKNKILTKTSLILMTSIIDLEDTQAWTSAGITSYLTKPARQSEIYNALLTTVCLPDQYLSDGLKDNQKSDFKLFNAHILIAEDNPVNQELAQLMLEEHGCTVKIASTGRKAISALEENKEKPFDLILMDCQMPEMDGYETTEMIRASEDRERLPIIALTANAMEGDRQRCLNTGMDDYLTKPFSRNQLSQILEKWLPDTAIENVNDSSSQTENVYNLVQDQKDNFSIEDDEFEAESHPATTDHGETEIENVGQLNRNTINNIRALQREGAPDILEKIIRLYLDNSSKIMIEIQQSIEKRDSKKIRSEAHSLKSSSANLGADNLADLCKEMEILGKNNQLEEIDQKLNQLKQAYDLSCRALQSEIN